MKYLPLCLIGAGVVLIVFSQVVYPMLVPRVEARFVEVGVGTGGSWAAEDFGLKGPLVGIANTTLPTSWYRTYARFDLIELPENAIVENAVLNFCVESHPQWGKYYPWQEDLKVQIWRVAEFDPLELDGRAIKKGTLLIQPLELVGEFLLEKHWRPSGMPGLRCYEFDLIDVLKQQRFLHLAWISEERSLPLFDTETPDVINLVVMVIDIRLRVEYVVPAPEVPPPENLELVPPPEEKEIVLETEPKPPAWPAYVGIGLVVIGGMLFVMVRRWP